MDFENKERILFGGPVIVRDNKNSEKRSFGIFMMLLLILLPVIAILACVVFVGGNDGSEPNNGVVGGGSTDFFDSCSTENDTFSEETTEIFSEIGEDSTGENFESGNDGNFDKTVSLDLSRSEMGDYYIYNYSSLDIDSKKLLDSPCAGAKYSFSEEPLVMIVHSHTSCGYSDFDVEDPLSVLKSSVVAVGERLSERLNKIGISSVHVSVIHDYDGSDTYAETEKTIKTMMEIYPTIEYVIDIGRFEMIDERGRDIKTESANGYAQVRLTVSAQGENLKEDLSLGLKLRAHLNSDAKNLCMPVVIAEDSYNVGISKYYFRADFGTVVNSSDEAHGAAEAFAEAFKSVIKKKVNN